MFKDKHTREKPKAEIKYSVKCKVYAHDEHNEMKYKQQLIIREPPVQFKMGERQEEVSQITTCCCMDQGTSKMWSEFEKNIFLPNEIVRGFVHVDNEHCAIACKEVKFAIEQRMQFDIHGHHHTITKHMIERNEAGPGPGEKDWKSEMHVDLS